MAYLFLILFIFLPILYISLSGGILSIFGIILLAAFIVFILSTIKNGYYLQKEETEAKGWWDVWWKEIFDSIDAES